MMPITFIYFYVKTVDPISPCTDPNWMLLFIDGDRNKGTGWEGYDYVVNLGVTSATQTTLKQWTGSAWGNAVTVTYKVVGNEMELSIPRSSLLMTTGTPEFYFHWSDNPQQLNDISAFFTDGDSAPDRRFNYNFSTSKIVPVNGDVLLLLRFAEANIVSNFSGVEDGNGELRHEIPVAGVACKQTG